MSKQRHIIARTVLELDTQQLADVWSLQSDVSLVFQNQGLREMADLFDRLVGEEEVVRLDRVEVDIGSIERRFLADEFIHKLLAALRETLGDRLSDRLLNHNLAKPEKITHNASDWKVLLYFLRYGRLPWWCPVRDWQEWLPRWLVVMQFDTNWRDDLRELLINYPAAQQRLVEQLPEGFRHQLVLHLQPTWVSWHNLLTEAKQLIQALVLDRSAVRYLEQQAWLLLFGEIAGDNASSRAFPVNWTHNWLAQLVSIWRQSVKKEAGSREQESKGNYPDTLYQNARQRLCAILAAVPDGEQFLWLTALDEALTSIADITQQNPESIFTTPSEQSQEEDEEQVHTPQTDGEMLLYFLQYGRFPGEQSSANWQDWLYRWSILVQNDTDWQLSLRRLLREKPEARQRLVAQLPENLRHQLLLQLQPSWGNWRNLLTQATELMRGLGISDNICEDLVQQAWLLLVAEITEDKAPETPLPATTWTRNWLIQLVETWLEAPFAEEARSSWRQEISPVSSLQPVSDAVAYQHLRSIITTLLIAEVSPWLTALEQVLTNTPAKASTNTIAPSVNSQVNSIITFANNSILSTAEETAGLYITQAGLVLLHPFIRFYLEAVGLLNNESFRDESAQHTAIYLMYYLATKQTDAPEYELVLPKLLCGWSLNRPVVRGLDLPVAALEEGERLLQTVINYWQVLKSTSPDGLREGFLQRQGKLTRSGNSNWKLQVEQQAIDILLGSLPWGVSMVTLPWMEGLLMVEWV